MKKLCLLNFLAAAAISVTASDQAPVAGNPVPAAPAPVPPAAVGTPATPAAGAKIQFAEPIHDFGSVNAGEVRRVDFAFTNTGNALLEVTEVRPTCGCTTAGTWTRTVEPGKTGTIPLQLNTANFQGPVVKFVTVVCNDPTQQNIQLQLKANIWKPIDVMPNFVMFNLNSASQTSEVRVVKITNNTTNLIEVSPPESSNPVFRAELKTLEPGKVFELHIFPQAPFTPGTPQGAITAKTTSSNMPVVSVTALAMVQPPVVAVPAQVYLPPGPLANSTPITVLVQNNTAEAISLSDVKVSLDKVEVKVNETQPGKVFSLTLMFPQGFELPQGTPATLSLKTSHASVPTINVPVVQPPRPPQYTAPSAPIRVVPPPPEYLRAPPTPPRVPPPTAAPGQVALPRTLPVHPPLPPMPPATVVPPRPATNPGS
jgi:hypothetical protein